MMHPCQCSVVINGEKYTSVGLGNHGEQERLGMELGFSKNEMGGMWSAQSTASIVDAIPFAKLAAVFAKPLMKMAGSYFSFAAKGGITDLQLVTRAAQKAEAAIGGTGRFAGTAKHTYANNLLSRYQSIYGDRGLRFNQYFNNNALYGPGNRGFLDVVNRQTMTIYDYKFGNAVMSNSQFLKYSNNFQGYSIQIIRP